MKFSSTLLLLLTSVASTAQTQIDSLTKDWFVQSTFKVSKNMTVDLKDGTIGLGADFPFLNSLNVRDSTLKIHNAYTFYAGGSPWSLKHYLGQNKYVVLDWYESGQLRSRSFFEDDKLTHKISLYENGQSQGKFKIVDGNIEGYTIWYNENGTKASEGLYIKGNQVGKWKFYDKNGKHRRVKEL